MAISKHFLLLPLICVIFTESSAGKVGQRTPGLSSEGGEKLFEMLRACAHAPPATEEGLEVDHHYKLAEALLKDSEIFKDNSWLKKSTGMYTCICVLLSQLKLSMLYN